MDDMVNALQKAHDNNIDINTFRNPSTQTPAYSIDIETSASNQTTTNNSSQLSTNSDNIESGYVAHATLYGNKSNQSTYNETIDQIADRYAAKEQSGTAAPAPSSVSEIGGVELSYSQLKSLTAYADKNNISLENTIENIKQESNGAISYTNANGNQISISPEGSYTTTITNDGVTQYVAYSKGVKYTKTPNEPLEDKEDGETVLHAMNTFISTGVIANVA